jgi:hypothetical protein
MKMRVHFYKNQIGCLNNGLKKFNTKHFRDYLKKFVEGQAERLHKEREIIQAVISCGEEKVHVAIYCQRYNPTDRTYYAGHTVYGTESDVTNFIQKHPTEEGWSCHGGTIMIVGDVICKRVDTSLPEQLKEELAREEQIEEMLRP